jgi:hypothetical protein
LVIRTQNGKNVALCCSNESINVSVVTVDLRENRSLPRKAVIEVYPALTNVEGSGLAQIVQTEPISNILRPTITRRRPLFRQEVIMNSRLFCFVALAMGVCGLVNAPAQAQYLDGYGFGAGLGFGGYGNQGLGNRANAYKLPYFAVHPPVYYSGDIVRRPYGVSPFAAPPGIMPVEMQVAPQSIEIVNQYYQMKPQSVPYTNSKDGASSGEPTASEATAPKDSEVVPVDKQSDDSTPSPSDIPVPNDAPAAVEPTPAPQPIINPESAQPTNAADKTTQAATRKFDVVVVNPFFQSKSERVAARMK